MRKENIHTNNGRTNEVRVVYFYAKVCFIYFYRIFITSSSPTASERASVVYLPSYFIPPPRARKPRTAAAAPINFSYYEKTKNELHFQQNPEQEALKSKIS